MPEIACQTDLQCPVWRDHHGDLCSHLRKRYKCQECQDEKARAAYNIVEGNLKAQIAKRDAHVLRIQRIKEEIRLEKKKTTKRFKAEDLVDPQLKMEIDRIKTETQVVLDKQRAETAFVKLLATGFFAIDSIPREERAIMIQKRPREPEPDSEPPKAFKFTCPEVDTGGGSEAGSVFF